MSRMTLCLCLAGFLSLTIASAAEKDNTAKPNGNRLTYLDEPCNPWYPHRDFPKLTTPMWIGEEGVEAVVILGIDDMRGHEKWEAYLRPILNRLKQIDGRAPVSIFTCSIDPKHPHLQQWLEEGLSLEIHTIDHPCPLLNSGDLAKAKSTVDRCIDLLNEVPNNKPVCFRMPCCDSLNTLSPRFYTEIFNKTTPKGNFLLANSSVMHLFTSDDPALPRELVVDADGQPKFKKYLPADRFFTNYIENYPYPFVVDRLCWEFPTVLPSDWSAQHRHKPHNPVTVEDWKAALDCTVIKQGVFCLVFHPHNWIKPEQINELIDHAVTKHGQKVKFLNFREAVERLNKNVLGGESLRSAKGDDNGVRLVERPYSKLLGGVEIDFLVQLKRPVAFGSRSWDETKKSWQDMPPHFILDRKGNLIPNPVVNPNDTLDSLDDLRLQASLPFSLPFPIKTKGENLRLKLHDIDHYFLEDLLIQTPEGSGVFRAELNNDLRDKWKWVRLPFGIPKDVLLPSSGVVDSGLRFIDIDEDGHDDIVFSNHERYGIWLWESLEKGWSREVLSAKRGDKPAEQELPPIVRQDGSNNGFWVHKRELVWMNEDTAKSKDLVERRSFDQLLANVEPGPKSPEQSLKMMQVKPGYLVELVAAEPLVRDPVAFEWGPDGKLWVAEMADYPLGVGEGEEADGADASLKANGGRQPPGPSEIRPPNPNPKSTSGLTPTVRLERAGYKLGGGRVRFLEDTDGDGKYDKSTVFLDKLNFPNGVMPWRDGVLISAAPDVLFARDTNGDGRADEVKVLLTGFGEGNQQHRVNGFSWGLDNMVHCANGDSGGQIKVVACLECGDSSPLSLSPSRHKSGQALPEKQNDNSKGKESGDESPHSKWIGKVIDIRGRDFRWNPDTGELDPTSGQTQFGRNRDDIGNWFGNNNANPMYHFVLDDYYIRRNPHVAPPDARKHVSITPGPSPVFPISRTLARFNDFAMANRFTSANSAMVYRDELLFERSRHAPRDEPKRDSTPKSENAPTPVERSARHAERDGYVAHVFISEPVHNLVHHEVMTADGVTFTSRREDDEQQSEFLASRDNWFRPTQIKTGPDGALYIADMYRQVIEHPQYIPPALQEKLDLRAGHDKGRIYRVVRIGQPLHPVPNFNTLELYDLIKAIDHSNGWQRDMAHRLLLSKWTALRDARSLLPSSIVNDEIEKRVFQAKVRSVVLNLLESPRVATRLQGLVALQAIDALKTEHVVKSLSDEHPSVRRFAVQFSESVKAPISDAHFNQLAEMGRDPDPCVRMQLAYTLGHARFTSLGNELGKLLYRERDDKYLVAAAMSSIHAQNVASVVANVFESAGREPLPPPLASTLLGLASTLGNDQALLSLIEYVLSGAATTESQPVVLAQMLESLDRRGTSLSQLKDVNPQRLAQAQQQLAERIDAARKQIADFESQIPNLKSEISNLKSNEALAAMPLLGREPPRRAEDARLIATLLVPQTPAPVQTAAVATLARINQADSAAALLSGWRTFTPSLRAQVLDALLSRAAWTDKLLDEIMAKTISPADIDAARRQRLIAHSNETIRTRAATLLEVSPNADRQKIVAEVAAKLNELNAAGDANAGAEVFKKRCATCHKLKDIGTSVGSDLVSLTDKSTAGLLTAILDPNKAVEAKFLAYTAVNKQGQTFSGLIAAETGNSITLMAADGKQHALLRAQLDEIVSSNKSFMPEGLEKDVSPRELADVIAFVQSSGPPPKKFDGNQPEPVTADASGTLKLFATNAEIYGKRLVFEPPFKNLGYWGSVDDRAIWTINVSQAGKYNLRLNYACDNSTAGNELVITVADQRLTYKVTGTGSWENYQTFILGDLTLPAGEHRLTAQAAESLKNHLLDWKELRLIPSP